MLYYTPLSAADTLSVNTKRNITAPRWPVRKLR